MRTALSVVLTLCPPGPDERNTSILRSCGSILTSTSSASGSTATVAAEVWIRPCVSVAGNPLDPVHAGLAAQEPVRLRAAHRDDGLLDAAKGAVAEGDRLPAEAVALGEALVHAVEVGGEQRGFVSAGSGADFHDGVAIIVGVARDEQLLKLVGESWRLREAGGRDRPWRARQARDRPRRSSSRACSSSFSSRASRSARRTIGASRVCSRPSDCSCAGSRATPGRRGPARLPPPACSAWRSRASTCYALGAAAAGSVWYFRRNRSTRPAVSTRRCLPVKYGWHCAQTSTWIDVAVERVSN